MPAYEADLERFAGYDAQVLGISVDSVPCNTAWAKSLGGLSYDLLSDFHPKGEVAKAYGAYRANDGISEELSSLSIKKASSPSSIFTTLPISRTMKICSKCCGSFR